MVADRIIMVASLFAVFSSREDQHLVDGGSDETASGDRLAENEHGALDPITTTTIL
jgi:hypothetical protein